MRFDWMWAMVFLVCVLLLSLFGVLGFILCLSSRISRDFSSQENWQYSRFDYCAGIPNFSWFLSVFNFFVISSALTTPKKRKLWNAAKNAFHSLIIINDRRCFIIISHALNISYVERGLVLNQRFSTNSHHSTPRTVLL